MSINLPDKCVITFFRKELDQFAAQNNLPIIGYLNSEVFDIPVYEYVCGADRLCITMAFCGGPGAAVKPGAAVTLEELHAMGCQKFIICGGAGALTKNSQVGEIIVSCLKQMGIPFSTGKTWTNDAIYRETADMIELRRNEGCITVEMEAAAFFAVSQYYNIPLAQLLYTGDDVSGEAWDSRNWNTQKNIRYNLISTAVEIVMSIYKFKVNDETQTYRESDIYPYPYL